MHEFIDRIKDANGNITTQGTPINREALMALQEFEPKTIEFIGNTIVETNSLNQQKTTEFLESGSIKETFVGEKTIIKTITFNLDGSITEEIT